jgi:hypothetical protein
MTHPASLLRESLQAYRHNAKAWLTMVIPLGILVAIAIASSVFIASDIVGVRIFLVSSLGGGVAALIFFALFAAAVFFGRTFLNASVHAAAKALEGGKLDIMESYRHGVKTFWPVLWVTALRTLMIAGGLILLIVPGVIWALRYSMVTQAIVLEGKRGMDAFRRSKELTSGNMLEALIDFGALGALIGYGVWIAMAAAVFILMVLGSFAVAVLPRASYGVAGIVMGALIVIVEASIVWAALPLSPIVFTSVYKDFSAKR